MRTLLLAAASVLAAGCATNPYVAPVRPPPLPSRSDTFEPQMQRALFLVDQQYDLYEAKIREEYDRQQGVSGALLVIGTAVLGAAAGNAHRDAILAGALTGALVYQLGSWNSSRARPEIYVEGMKAMACVKAAVAPLNVSNSYLLQVQNQAVGTAAASDLAGRSFGEVKRWLSLVAAQQPAGQKPVIVADAEAALTAFPAVQSQVSETIGRAKALQQSVGAAGQRLEARLDDIKQLITKALNGTISDLSALKGAIADLSGLTAVFAPGLKIDTAVRTKIDTINAKIAPSTKVNTESGAIDDEQPAPPRQRSVDPVAELAHALGKLAGNTRLMASRADVLSKLIEEPAKVESKKGLDGCGVDTAIGAFRVDRSTLTFMAGKARTSFVTLTGGTKPYSAEPLDLPKPKGFDVSIPPGSALLAVVADSETEAGAMFQIRVSDSTGANAIVTVTVEAKSGTGGNVGTGQPGTGGQGGNVSTLGATGTKFTCQGQQGRSALQVCLVQQVTGAAVDGAFGTDSCSRFRSHPLTQSFKGLLNDQAMAAITGSVGLPDKPTDAQIGATLAQRGVHSCKGVALAAAVPGAGAVATTLAAACVPIAPGQHCEVDGAQCDLECRVSKDQFKTLANALSLKPPPDRFDVTMREALGRFQKQRSLNVQTGQLTKETAALLIP